MRLRIAVPLVAGGMLVAGCGAGTPAPPPSPIPPVQKARDVAMVAGRPCDLLSEAQATHFGLDRPPKRLPGAGRGKVDCEWRSSQDDVWVYISTSPHKSTLEGIYAHRAGLAAFELTKVAGYPVTAVRVDPKRPVCDVDIKPAEGQSITVSYDSTKLGEEPRRGCAIGKEVAQAVVQNVPAKRG